ncbi:helix-turn-helix domain-containing protein [Chloroflexota bacterium]
MTADFNNMNMLTVGQVARLLHMHPNTVRRWSNKGVLKSYRICKRGDRRFIKEDVSQLLFEIGLLDYDIKSIERKDNLLVPA